LCKYIHTSILSPTPHSLDIVVSIILDRGARGIVRPMCLLHERNVNHNRKARFVRGGIWAQMLLIPGHRESTSCGESEIFRRRWGRFAGAPAEVMEWGTWISTRVQTTWVVRETLWAMQAIMSSVHEHTPCWTMSAALMYICADDIDILNIDILNLSTSQTLMCARLCVPCIQGVVLCAPEPVAELCTHKRGVRVYVCRVSRGGFFAHQSRWLRCATVFAYPPQLRSLFCASFLQAAAKHHCFKVRGPWPRARILAPIWDGSSLCGQKTRVAVTVCCLLLSLRLLLNKNS